MKSVVKKSVRYFVVVAILSVAFLGNVRALGYYSNWDNYVQGNQWVGMSWQEKTNASNSVVNVNWKEAEGSSFKMYFRILNTNFSEIDSCTINFKSSATMNPNLVTGREYLLQGKKTDYFSGKSYVKGEWKIN